jgi:hypothetical protein
MISQEASADMGEYACSEPVMRHQVSGTLFLVGFLIRPVQLQKMFVQSMAIKW